ncbi:MAG: DUF1007 family protein [Hyphomicrobiaceae bacterium]
MIERSNCLEKGATARPTRRPAIAALLAAGLALGLAAPAQAHPHIWVSVKTEVIYGNGTITGFRHAWTFDEFYSAMAIEGLDKNNDGIYSPDELSELAKVNVEALKEFDYFTFPRLGEQPQALAAPKDYALALHDKAPLPAGAEANIPVLPREGADRVAADAAKPAKVLTLTFTLPLAKPVLADAEGFSFSIADPAFFIAFEPARESPVSLGAGAPKGCRVASPAAKPDDANPSKPGDLMAAQQSGPTVNLVSAPQWAVTCAPAG